MEGKNLVNSQSGNTMALAASRAAGYCLSIPQLAQFHMLGAIRTSATVYPGAWSASGQLGLALPQELGVVLLKLDSSNSNNPNTNLRI